MIELFLAIVFLESGGNCRAVGDCGRAVGPAQISAAVVADCNRIAGKSYTLADRQSLEKSQEMFLIYTEHYGKRFGVPITDEVRARIWNGGPNGPSKQATDRYWKTIKTLRGL